jgi:hypothetical protein
MPQLDMVSWFHQVFSTLLVISVFYLALSLKFLPSLTSIIKGRYKLQLFRKYCVQFLNLQTNVLKQQTFNNLSLLSVNSLVLLNSFFAPLFAISLTKNLTYICYNKAHIDNTPIGLIDEEILESTLDDELFLESEFLKVLLETGDLGDVDLESIYLPKVRNYLASYYLSLLEYNVEDEADEDCELLNDSEGLSLASTATYFKTFGGRSK